LVEREARDPELIQTILLNYWGGKSLRRTAEYYQLKGEDITWRSVDYWVQKAGNHVQDELWTGDLPEEIVVIDETKIQLGNHHWNLYAAIHPETKRILFAKLYPTRNLLTTKDFVPKND